MAERSASPAVVRTEHLDIQITRASASDLLGPGAPLPRFDDLDEKTSRVRGNLLLLIPLVEDAALALAEGDVARASAVAAVESARVRLTASPGPGLVSARNHAQSLAREVLWLCDQYETLVGVRTAEPA